MKKENSLVKVALIFAFLCGWFLWICFSDHKDCAKVSFWDGKTSLGDPAVVMIVKYYESRWDFIHYKSTCDSKIMYDLSIELYGTELYEVPESEYNIIYMAPNGSHKIVPVFIDNENEIAISLHTKGHELWKILDSIPKVKYYGTDSMMENFEKPRAPVIPRGAG